MSADLQNNPYVSGVSPRWLLLATITNPTDRNQNISTYLLIVNTTNEILLDIGRAFAFESLKGNEVITQSSNLIPLGISTDSGTDLNLTINFKSILSLFIKDVPIPDRLLSFTSTMKLKMVKYLSELR